MLEFTWRNAEFFGKHPAEILRVVEPHGVGHFADRHGFVPQEFFGFGQADGADEKGGRFPGEGLPFRSPQFSPVAANTAPKD